MGKKEGKTFSRTGTQILGHSRPSKKQKKGLEKVDPK